MLRFGTDGVRGLANAELGPELVMALGRAAARALAGPSLEGRRRFLVGRDTRWSGPLLQAALSAGLAGEGIDVVDVGVNTVMIQIGGEEEKIDAFVELVRPYGIRELARTGVIAMPRGSSTVSAPDEEGAAARREGIHKPARGVAGASEPTQEELEGIPPG